MRAQSSPGREIALLRARLDRGEEQLALAERRLEEAERAGGRAAELELELSGCRVEEDALRARVEDLAQRLETAYRLNDELMASASWRVTRPLRAVKQAARR